MKPSGKHALVSHSMAHASWSSRALASWRSAVANPSVNQPYTGGSRSEASWGLPCYRYSRPRCNTPVASGATAIQCRKLCPEGLEDEHRTSVTRNFHDRAPIHRRLRESYPLAKRLNPSTLMHTTILQTQCRGVYLLVTAHGHGSVRGHLHSLNKTVMAPLLGSQDRGNPLA
jgi:hypothetical protein